MQIKRRERAERESKEGALEDMASNIQMRKLRSREERVRVRYPEGPNTELKSGSLAHPGWYSCPFCIVQVGPNPFLCTNPHHITMGRDFQALVPHHTGQSLHRTEENFRLKDRL